MFYGFNCWLQEFLSHTLLDSWFMKPHTRAEAENRHGPLQVAEGVRPVSSRKFFYISEASALTSNEARCEHANPAAAADR